MNLFFFVLLMASLVFSRSAEDNGIRGRIFNGQDAEDGEFKFMAFLVSNMKTCCGLMRSTHICGGAIIAPNWVLTAAHCVHGMVTITVYLGSIVAEETSIAYKVSSSFFFHHSAYDERQMINDIALIQIPKTVECDTIRYARLPLPSADYTSAIFAKKIGIIMGWGEKGNRDEESEILQKAKVALMTTEECQVVLPYVNDMDICVRVSHPFGSICTGDSGGPLVLEESGELIGVASCLPHSSCEDGDPNIFMRITSYLPWISEAIGNINY